MDASTNLQRRALQKLALAVMQQALDDAKLGSPYRDKALAWINGKITNGLDFQLCCDLLELRVDYVREALWQSKMIPAPRPTTVLKVHKREAAAASRRPLSVAAG